MKRRFWIAGLGALIGFGLTRFVPPGSNPETRVTPAPVTPPRATKLVEALALPMEVPPAKEGEDGLSTECRALQHRLLELDLKDYTDLRFAGALFDLPLTRPGPFLNLLGESLDKVGSCETLPETHPLRSIHSLFAKTCRLRFDEGEIASDGAKARAVDWCFHLWQRYRLNLIAQASMNRPLPSISDERLLVARLGAGLTAIRGPAQYDDLLPVLERLNQLKPEAGYDRFARRLEFERLLETSSLEEHDARRNALERKLAQLPPEDTHALEIRLLLAKDAGDWDRMEAFARQLGRSSPEKATYYLAWSAYLSDRKEKAMEYLASLSNPSPLAQFALSQLKDGSEQAKTPFTGAGLGLGLKTSSP